MPVIAPHYFNIRLSDVSDDTYSYKATVSVTSKGEFAIHIPEDLIPACKELAESEPRVSVEERKKGTAVYSHDKTLAVDLISRAIRIFAKADITTEIVICYEHDSEGKYVVGPHGEIATDGYDADENYGRSHSSNERLKDGWRWSEKEHHAFGNRSVFKFGIGAQVYKKTTMKRTTGTTIKYEIYWGESASHFDRKTYCQRLNSFDVSFGLSSGNNQYSTHNEIPYTEDAAKFFFDAMVALCSISERVKNFFGDTKTLQKAIESRASLMLGAGK
jgi:hypothetical protein